jgi:hypothetical protein
VAHLVGHTYEWSRHDDKSYRCGTRDIAADHHYTLRVVREMFIRHDWVATKIETIENTQGVESGGCFGLAHERYLERAKRV